MEQLIFTPTDFVAIFNQSIDMIYPSVVIEGEVSNLRIAKNRWVYFDIKDTLASLKVFATVYQLSYPIEDGMMIRLIAQPRLHPLYNFSLNAVSLVPKGEGSIKKASEILKAKLESEGLFAVERKRFLPYPPERIGLITSSEAAAYGDFVKVLGERWPLAEIILADVAVQGDSAAPSVVAAIHKFNQLADCDVLVIIRGGGSADDLVAFSDETLVRAVAESRIPTVVAIGHERDVSLAELAADLRASTPSNAAELLAPDRRDVLATLGSNTQMLINMLQDKVDSRRNVIQTLTQGLRHELSNIATRERSRLEQQRLLLTALNPAEVLKRGYALVKQNSRVVRVGSKLKSGDLVQLTFSDSVRRAEITE